jgi:hypothetical protein
MIAAVDADVAREGRAGSVTSTKMFPGCMSAWKKLSRNTCVKKIFTPRSASSLMSTPAAFSAVDIGYRDAVDALHHEHVASRVVPVHLGHVEQVRVEEVAPQLRGVGGLALQVELVEHGLLVTRVSPRPGAGAARLDGSARASAPACRAGGGPRRIVRSTMPGRITFTTTLAAIEQRGGVHLRDRGRGERCRPRSWRTAVRRACRARARRWRCASAAGEGRHGILQARSVRRRCRAQSGRAASTAAGRT